MKYILSICSFILAVSFYNLGHASQINNEEVTPEKLRALVIEFDALKVVPATFYSKQDEAIQKARIEIEVLMTAFNYARDMKSCPSNPLENLDVKGIYEHLLSLKDYYSNSNSRPLETGKFWQFLDPLRVSLGLIEKNNYFLPKGGPGVRKRCFVSDVKKYGSSLYLDDYLKAYQNLISSLGQESPQEEDFKNLYDIHQKFLDSHRLANFLEKEIKWCKEGDVREAARVHFYIAAYKKAVKYYKRLKNNSSLLNQEDYYALGASYLHLAKEDKADKNFIQALCAGSGSSPHPHHQPSGKYGFFSKGVENFLFMLERLYQSKKPSVQDRLFDKRSLIHLSLMLWKQMDPNSSLQGKIEDWSTKIRTHEKIAQQFERAFKGRDWERLIYLLENRRDFGWPIDMRNWAESIATESLNSGNVKLLSLLVEAGDHINVRDKNGDTLLMQVLNKYLFLEKLRTLEVVNAESIDPLNPLDRRVERFSTVDELQAKREKTSDMRDRSLKDAHHEALLTLVKDGVHINVPNNKGDTPLMRAVKAGNIDIVKLLVQNRADIELKNKEGKSAFDLATDPAIKNYLKSHRSLSSLSRDAIIKGVKEGKITQQALQKLPENILKTLPADIKPKADGANKQ